METLKFKTNIKCGGCIATVTPTLDSLSEIAKWNVDTGNSDKILTVETLGGIKEQQIIDLLTKIGYHAEVL